MALWRYHFFDADKNNRNIKIARLFEQRYGWNLFTLFLWVIDHKNCANIILFHQSTSSFNKICNTTKKWCVVNLTNRWRPIVYKQFIDVSRNSALFFHQSTSSFKNIYNTTKEMMRSKCWQNGILSTTQTLIEKVNIGVNNNEKCFWTPFCFFQKRHNYILW